MIRLSSLSLALGASVALHAAAIGALQALPGGWQLGERTEDRAVAAVLHATLGAPAPAAAEMPPRAKAKSAAAPKKAATAQADGSPKAGLGPVYYPAHLLDERPQVRTHVEPKFPDAAEIAGGRVVVDLLINEHGAVDEVVIKEARPAGYFEAATAQAFGAALFRPGHKAGVPVKSRLAIEVLFGTPTPISPSAAINGGRYE